MQRATVTRRWDWAVVAVLVQAAVLCGEPKLAPTRYREFTIEDIQIRNVPDYQEAAAATRQQIDMVWAVGLPREALEFFRGVPFVLVPPQTFRAPTPGMYDTRSRTVKVSTRIAAIGHKPVLLHELLHAYHHEKLPDGNRNGAVLALYEKAKAAGVFVARSHMMRNPGEYFACAATTYLFGVTAQEPFTREKLAEKQPELFAHLKTLFGPDAGGYRGSLTRNAGEKDEP